MADEQPSPPAPPAPTTPPPGEPYGSSQGAPPPASRPYGSPSAEPPGAQRPAWPPAGAGPGGPPQQPPPWGPPPPQPVPGATPEQLAVAARLSRLALLSAIAAPLVTLLSLPYSALLGLGFGIVAIVLGVRARRAAVVARRSEAGGVVAIVLGSVGTAFISVVIACYAVFWGEVRTYEDCMAGANTKQAESVCTEQLIDDARRRVGLD